MSQEPNPSLSKPRRKRDKLQYSCNACRQRKSRCDRLQPACSGCLHRGLACVYSVSRPPGSSPAPVVYDRLVHLEGLVKALMADGGVRAPNSTASSARPESASENEALDTQSECGSMQITESELRYVAGEHWAVILDSIADLKAHCDREEQLGLVETPPDPSDNEAAHVRHALLLYGCHRAASRAEIIAALPPKVAVDRYISRYFNYLDLVASAAVHGPSFIREYEAFWADPSRPSILWVGLLFSMICLAVMASDGPEAEQKSLQIDLYREKIVQCLVMGEYTKPGPYVLETVVHYLYIEFGINPDADRNIWFLLGLEVNLAMRMGLHRDPGHFPRISILEAEMRRRLWATVLTSDILLSSQMGMPRMICDWKCDTGEPRNLNDTDLGPDLTQLPPARPETEHTTALGIIARRRMIVALGAIADLVDSVKAVSYAEIMQTDRKLHDAVARIPPPLRIKPLAASVTDPPQVILSRLFLGHLLYKGQIMLHRRYLDMPCTTTTGDPEDPFVYSRTACLDASLGTLHIQQILDEETCPGGRLHELRWRITSSMTHLFLTATMVLCSLLHRGQPLGDRTEEVLAALRRARTIWMRRSSSSREAKRATEIVSFTLARTEDEPVAASTEMDYTGYAWSQPIGANEGFSPMMNDWLQMQWLGQDTLFPG
ncbi:hypothetical protein ASPZODRAFT_155294 [Penicilliopsis zonata CBS 506.65]|uniref:Zn(2)-C6 fungal-type domain-containing protein n=1 Tax=Penicilliopsis zonata CBS 506.65 TaxID=1073090 RepID=A0A1L9S5D2_9EURO|nr:hypothetical protein ASPZODRAFT_155294 [Penicilliopsis zonata CBS 506.65]OJJ42365.1 hypothetical protein ASPZODRAFT_155294 [Penicilliopsis zonata CBS 506.65]